MASATKPSSVAKFTELPKEGKFGEFGGQFVPEILMPALRALENDYLSIRTQARFQNELKALRTDYCGRPTPLYFARRLTEYAGGARIFLKREDLLHGGSHSINNALGQALLARELRRSRVLCATGSGEHGLATAMACVLLELQAEIYMGAADIERHATTVEQMKLLGARVHAVTRGSQRLKDATHEALRAWVTHLQDAYYLIGSSVGPHPYPLIVRDFQRVIGDEIKGQLLRREQRLPDLVVAAVGQGGSAIGTFFPFVQDEKVRLLGVEAAEAASLTQGTVGVFHGAKTYLLQDEHGQVQPTHSLAAELDYAAVGPEHAFYKKLGRAEYIAVSGREALEGGRLLAELEGILPSLEAAHAIYAGVQRAKKLKRDQIVVITLSGRGEKDLRLYYDRQQLSGQAV
ncbi:MAG: tryptophan synthase subunit beta [Candidatus Bipolaricaulota bacterium]|nr:tryptophan synthase subunit beta [Candidatus Bipolaricaulota bacterium]MCS7275018.1 tryptophan synthase subunit beta [Candidatus Bipolaricaulota bacterium]MDW8110328.1 tryptophan synthase subunit beta [Candidatus Bipolaricaulota bacterium]MDW8328776.1 tryptophan synthase subunit beta [Candidatus Bipolaricaulota bacterium]